MVGGPDLGCFSTFQYVLESFPIDVKKLLLSVSRAYDPILWIYPSLFNQSPMEGHLRCFYSLQNILLLRNRAAMNNLVHPSFWTFPSVLGQTPLEVELGHGFRV